MPLLNMTRSGVMVSAEMAEVDIRTALAHLDQKQRIDDLHRDSEARLKIKGVNVATLSK